MSESVHTDLKVFVAQNKIKNITSFVDEAVLAKMRNFFKKKTQ